MVEHPCHTLCCEESERPNPAAQNRDRSAGPSDADIVRERERERGQTDRDYLHERRRRTHGGPEDLSELRPQPWQFLRKVDLLRKWKESHIYTHKATHIYTYV